MRLQTRSPSSFNLKKGVSLEGLVRVLFEVEVKPTKPSAMESIDLQSARLRVQSNSSLYSRPPDQLAGTVGYRE
jgi:hypothetical protein